MVKQALDGFNCTLFAYGQTGSGKSHSMMGAGDLKGIIPRLNDDLWVKIANIMEGLEKKRSEGVGGVTKYMITVSQSTK